MKSSSLGNLVRRSGSWLGLLLIPLCFGPQLQDIVSRARSGVEQNYIFLVPLVAAYLVFIRSSRLRSRRSIRGAWVGILLVLSSFVCSLVGHDRDILILWQASPLLALAGLIVACLGIARFLALAPGVLVLFACLPMPGTIRLWIAQPLQGLATSVTAFVLDIVGVAAERVGNLIEINGAPVAIGEACNGMRLVMPLAIVMYAFVFSLPLRPVTRLVLVLLSLPVALLCNVLRLIPTALAYGYLPEQAIEIHDLLGWLMIPVALGLMLGILRLLEWLDLPVARLRLALS